MSGVSQSGLLAPGVMVDIKSVALKAESGTPLDFDLDSPKFGITFTSGAVSMEIFDETTARMDVCPGDINSSGVTNDNDLLNLFAGGPAPFHVPGTSIRTARPTWSTCSPSSRTGASVLELLDRVHAYSTWRYKP